MAQARSLDGEEVGEMIGPSGAPEAVPRLLAELAARVIPQQAVELPRVGLWSDYLQSGDHMLDDPDGREVEHIDPTRSDFWPLATGG